MNLERTTLAIEPRSLGECIDLAVLFYREHARKIVTLTLVFGAPATLVAYASTRASDTGWLWSLLVFFFLAPFLGAALAGAAGHQVFGAPLRASATLQLLLARGVSLMAGVGVTRAATALTAVFCLGVPSLPIAVRYGFFPEVLLLEQLPLVRADRRLAELLRNHFWEAAARYVGIVGFAAMAGVSLFFLIDQACNWLLAAPLYLGKVVYPDEYFTLLFVDPIVVATWIGIAWLVYPLARLAWFFCYLDTRIRKEGWDVELSFRVEARRLASAP